MPALEQFRESPVPRGINREVAVRINQGGAHAHGRTCKTMASAVDGDGVLDAGCFRHFLLSAAVHSAQVCPFAGHFHARLVKQGFVDVWAGHGQAHRG